MLISQYVFQDSAPNGSWAIAVGPDNPAKPNRISGTGYYRRPTHIERFHVTANGIPIAHRVKETTTMNGGVLDGFIETTFEYEIESDWVETTRIAVSLGNGAFNSHTAIHFTPNDLGFEYPAEGIVRRTGSPTTNIWKTIGSCAYRGASDIHARHRPGLNRKIDVLEWGCGFGNAARHFLRDERFNYTGMDADPVSNKFCRETLGPNFIVNPFDPPTEFQDQSFDLIFAMSVMTHLVPKDQAAWLKEFRRLIRPDGLAVLSFHGPWMIAHGNWATDYYEQMLRNGGYVGSGAANNDLIDVHGQRYTDNSFTYGFINRTWTEHFRVMEIIDGVFGLHSVAVLSPI